MAAGETYERLASTTVSGSSTTNVEFTSISGSYTDLILVFNGYTSSNGVLDVQVGNSTIDTGANYSGTRLIGYSGGTLSDRYTSQNQWQWSSSSSNWSNVTAQFFNYSNTTTHKNVLVRSAGGGASVGTEMWKWASTSAINRIKITANGSGNFTSGSTFTLYGIAAA